MDGPWTGRGRAGGTAQSNITAENRLHAVCTRKMDGWVARHARPTRPDHLAALPCHAKTMTTVPYGHAATHHNDWTWTHARLPRFPPRRPHAAGIEGADAGADADPSWSARPLRSRSRSRSASMRVPNAAVPVLTHASHRPGVYVQASSYDDEDDDDDSDHTDTDTDTTSSRPEPSRQHVPGQHHRRPPVQVRRRPPSRPPPRENNNTMYEEARDGQKSASRRPHSRSRQLFELSMTDPAAHMPPTCWTAEPIPNRHVDKRLDHRFEKQWNDEFAEFSTRKRLYCPAKHCGHWIESEDLRRREDGRKCGRCRRCKTKGWQRCHRCKAMVELDPGCNHMIW